MVEKLKGVVSGSEVCQMLKDFAWREVRKEWLSEANERSKLGVLQRLKRRGCELKCVQVGRKSLRRILAKLRGGTAELRVESGRWVGLSREDRSCTQCGSGEVEDVEHFLLRCNRMASERAEMKKHVEKIVVGFQDRCDEEKVVMVLDEAFADRRVGKAVEEMWRKRFGLPVPQVHDQAPSYICYLTYIIIYYDFHLVFPLL